MQPITQEQLALLVGLWHTSKAFHTTLHARMTYVAWWFAKYEETTETRAYKLIDRHLAGIDVTDPSFPKKYAATVGG